MTVRRYPPTSPTSGEDSRVTTTDRIDQQFHQSFASWPDRKTAVYRTDTSNEPREVEVQAFVPDTTGMSPGNVVVIALVQRGPTGQGDTLLSPQEARDIALALLRSADDADRIAIQIAQRVEVTA